jgi:hypothetical protein
MRKSKFSESQIVGILEEADEGVPVADLLRRHGVNLSMDASLEFGYRWLDLDDTSGEDLTLFKYDVLTQEPVAGFGFRF